MKRIVFAIIVIVLVLGLCACKQDGASNTMDTLSKDEERFVGTWSTALIEGKYYQSVRFMSNGKAIFTMHHKTELFEDQHCYGAGEWFVDDGRLVLTVLSEGGESIAYTFDVVGNTLEGTLNGKWTLTFTKTD